MSSSQQEKAKAYWSDTLKLLWTVLAIWAGVSYFAGIFFAGALNNITIGGFKLGFFFAQQGSIYVFVALIFWYAARMNRLDQEHDVHED